MIIDVPSHSGLKNGKLGNMSSVYLSVIMKQLKRVQQQVFQDMGEITQKLPYDTFKLQVMPQKCPSTGDVILLRKIKDDSCVAAKKELVTGSPRDEGRSPECDPIKLELTDNTQNDMSLDEDSVFKIENSCFLNKPHPQICPEFVPFLPVSTDCSFVQVLHEDCIYDVEIDKKNYMVIAVKEEDNKDNLFLRVLDKLPDKVDYSKPRRLDTDNSVLQAKIVQGNNTEFKEIHRVKKYRGPCIFNNFSQFFTKDCKVTYMDNVVQSNKQGPLAFESGFEITDLQNLIPVLYPPTDKAKIQKIKDDSSKSEGKEYFHIPGVGYNYYLNRRFAPMEVEEGIRFKCGLSPYLKGRMGFSKILTSSRLKSVDVSMPSMITLFASKSERDGSIATSSTLYSKARQTKEPKPDAIITAYGLHEKDALLTLMHHLETSKTGEYEVVHNTHFYKMKNVEFGGTPDGFVFKDNKLYATVEVKCHNPPTPPFLKVPERVELQAYSHVALVNSLVDNEMKINHCFVVSWTPKESRIFEYEKQSGTDNLIKELLKNIKSGKKTQEITRALPSAAGAAADCCNIPLQNPNIFTVNSVQAYDGGIQMFSSLNKEDEEYHVMYDKTVPFISLSDSNKNYVHFKKIEVSHLKQNVHDFENKSAAEIFLFFCSQNIESIFKGNGNLSVLKNDSKGKCDEEFEYNNSNFLFVSKPLFVNQEEFDKWKRKKEKFEIVGSLAYITKHNMVYIVPLVPVNAATADNDDFTTCRILDYDDTKFYNFIIHSENIEFSIMFNCDIHHRIRTLLEEEEKKDKLKKYDKVFWDTFFYFVSLLDEEDITLNISKLKVGDQDLEKKDEYVMKVLGQSYWNYENDRNQESTKKIRLPPDLQIDSHSLNNLFKLMLSRLQIKPSIHFSSKYMRNAIRHAIL
tara:strand:- start:2508 stop:5237 length:2730 start_codon:yes stop_codon:yes gene_type:complete